MTPPLRVAFVIDQLIAGAGTENQLVLLLEHMDKVNIEPHLVCLSDHPAFPKDQIHCPVHILHGQSVVSWKGVQNVRSLARLAKRHHWDVMVLFFRTSNTLGTLGGKLAGIPVVSSRRSLGKSYWHNRRRLFLLRMLNAWCSGIVANSEAVRQETLESEKVEPLKVHVIPNAIDHQHFQNVPDLKLRAEWGVGEDGLVVGCVANLRPIKGVDVLVRAFGSTSGIPGNAHLVLVGEGEQQGMLEQMVKAQGMEPRIHFVGKQTDVAPYLASFDVGVLPSLGESSSNALLEYMSAGLPVVATAVGGIPEMIQDGVTGLLVPPQDTVALGGAMVRVLENAGMRDKLGVAGKQVVRQRHGLSRVLQAWEDYLKTRVEKA